MCLAVWFHRLGLGCLKSNNLCNCALSPVWKRRQVAKQMTCLQCDSLCVFTDRWLGWLKSHNLCSWTLKSVWRSSPAQQCVFSCCASKIMQVCRALHRHTRPISHQDACVHVFWTTPTLHFHTCGFSPMWTSKWNVMIGALLNSFMSMRHASIYPFHQRLRLQTWPAWNTVSLKGEHFNVEIMNSSENAAIYINFLLTYIFVCFGK